MTIAWCLLILLGGYLAAGDVRWLWLVSGAIAGQYVTDHLDGKLGKHRDTGLVRWGYFVDHLLDYFFMCSILTSYALLLPEPLRFRMFFVLVVFGGFLVLVALNAGATGAFRIAAVGLGPTEFRLGLIVVNTLLITYGTRRLGAALPWVAGGGFLVLAAIAYRTQRRIWTLDMKIKADAEETRRRGPS
jgi:phosphatidylglycerophosphate synthase